MSDDTRVIVDCSLPPEHPKHITVKPLTQRDRATRRRDDSYALRQQQAEAERAASLAADLAAVADPAVRRLLERVLGRLGETGAPHATR